MGAFGELLIKHLGGDLDRYRGNIKTYGHPKPKSKTQIEKELKEKDEFLFEKIKRASEELRENLANNVKQLQQNEQQLVQMFKTKTQQIKFLKWKNKYLEETLKVFKQ